jgi:hypothetical protein
MTRLLLFIVFVALIGCEKKTEDNPNDPGYPPIDTTIVTGGPITGPWNPWELFDDLPEIPEWVYALDTVFNSEENIAMPTAQQLLRGHEQIFSTPGVDVFVIPAGDYTSLGRIRLPDTGGRRVVIRGTGDSKQVEGSTIFAAFEITSGSWVFDNLRFDDASQEAHGIKYGLNFKVTGGKKHVWNKCSWANAQLAIRLIDADSCTAQLCIFDDRALVPGDGGFIIISGSKGEEARFNRVIFNEIHNGADGAGGTPWSDSPSGSGSTPVTVFYGNSSFKDSRVYKAYNLNGIEYCAHIGEDGSDQKSGGLRPEDRSWFVANVSYGNYPTAIGCKEDPKQPCASAGSAGVGIGIWHNRAKYWNVWGNATVNSNWGIYIKGSDSEKHQVTDIDVGWNLIYAPSDCGAPSFNGRDTETGIAFKVMNDQCYVHDNIVVGGFMGDIFGKQERNVHLPQPDPQRNLTATPVHMNFWFLSNPEQGAVVALVPKSTG